MAMEGISFAAHFAQLPDPRLDRRKRHKLLDIVGITLCAVIAGADAWTEVAEYGRLKQEWLKTFLELPNGIPSHDTIGRVFSLLDPKAFQECFVNWVKAVCHELSGVVAIDGKTVRRSHDAASGKNAIHLVSAWASANHLVLGQVKVDEKSNEITAIPELLRVLSLEGCLVTLDAMGCQREIAQQITDAKAHYVLAVKENQQTLCEDIRQEFEQAMRDGFTHMNHTYHHGIEKSHGRIEERECWFTHDVEGIGPHDRWPKLTGMALCRATRTHHGQTSVETRYYITSVPKTDATCIAKAIRAHWGIENSMHWVLDMAFREDESRIRVGHAAENMATVRRFALNLLKNDKETKIGVKGKRLKAAWHNEYIEGLLTRMAF